MSSSRETQKVRSPFAVNLPKKARAFNSLLFRNKAAEDKKSTSAHLVNTVVKKDKKNSDSIYFFKHNEKNSYISELESSCCAIANFIAPNNVPTSRPYYNDEYEFIGLTSKAIPGFKSNRDDPLLEKDITIELRENDIEENRDRLLDAIKALMSRTERSGNSYKNFLNYYTNTSMTAVKFRQLLLEFQKKEDKFTQNSMFEFKNLLHARREHILKNISNYNEYDSELELIENAIPVAEYLFKYANCNIIKPETLEKLEYLDKTLRKKEIDLQKEKDNKIISINFQGEPFEISVKSIKNYRIVRGQAIGEITRYLAKDPDGHNKNMSKDGHIIDFDMAKLNLLFQFRKYGVRDKFFRMPTKDSFVVTERDLRFFPDLKNADFFYWPTKEMNGQSVVDSMPKIFENFFSTKDNEVYKKLAMNPVFIFFKFKTLLKYVLANEETYKEIVKLHLRTNISYVDEMGKTKNLFDDFIADELARIAEVKKTLFKMREFREFLDKQGNFAFSLIKEELLQYKMKHEKKLVEKPHYQKLVDSMNMANLEAKYHEILQITNIEKSSPKLR